MNFRHLAVSFACAGLAACSDSKPTSFSCEDGEEIEFETLAAHHSAILVGELHGTAEMPKAFANIVEQSTAADRRVAVALEFDRRWQSDIDAVMSAPNAKAAQAAFAHRATVDGRTSAAMRSMLYRLSALRRGGADVHVFAIDFWQRDQESKPYSAPDWLPNEVDIGKALRDIRMGEKSVADCLSVSCDLLLYYTGNFHSRNAISESSMFNAKTGEITSFISAPAGAIIAHEMPTAAIKLVHMGGSFKAQMADGIKVRDTPVNAPAYASAEARVYCAHKTSDHPFVYNVGTISSSSDDTASNP